MRFCLPSTNWSMHGVNLLTRSCPGPLSWFLFFDLMFIVIKNSCSHSYVEGKVSSGGTPGEASVKYEMPITSQKFIKEHSLCFALLSGPPKYL